MDEQTTSMAFMTLIHSLHGAAMMAMGKIPDPVSGEAEVDLPRASFNIDLLDALKTKSEGNRTKDEESLLGTILTNLRLTYVAEVDRQKTTEPEEPPPQPEAAPPDADEPE